MLMDSGPAWYKNMSLIRKARLASSLTSCRAYKGNQTELAEKQSSYTLYYFIYIYS